MLELRTETRSVIERHYPSARIIRNDRNLGFCGGNNVGVSAASHEWLFFLNDDTRVDPSLLRAAFETVARRQASSVAAFVLNWSGTHVDYAGGGVNFDGHGFQHGVGSSRLEDFARERPVAFANGAAMLVGGAFSDDWHVRKLDVDALKTQLAQAGPWQNATSAIAENTAGASRGTKTTAAAR